MIMSRAPMRISFAGGGTDIDAFACRWGGCVVSITIARYVRARMEPGESRYSCYPVAQDDTLFLEKMAAHFSPASLEVRVEAVPQSGLGASGALAVAVLGCLNTLKGDEPLALMQIVELAHRIESEEMGIAGGRQDPVASAFGGLNYIEFGDNRINVSRIEVKPEALLSLENSLILVFTQPRLGSSGDIMADEAKRLRDNDGTTLQSLMRQKELANDIRRTLRRGNLTDFGELLDEAWQVKKKQTPLTSNEFVDEIYEAGKKAGALGGKLSGAGGGGYLMFFAPGREGQVGEVMRHMGLTTETVTFDFQGLRVWQ